jgi:hypothetical protein
MAEKKPKVEPQVEPSIAEYETPEQKLENRILMLETVLEKHLRYHFGKVN